MTLTDSIVIQIVATLVGILSVIATRLIDRWLPPINKKKEDEDE